MPLCVADVFSFCLLERLLILVLMEICRSKSPRPEDREGSRIVTGPPNQCTSCVYILAAHALIFSIFHVQIFFSIYISLVYASVRLQNQKKKKTCIT